jgi:MoaA/NifB/PqqE/SkfB family radical SAM enzyme
LKNVDINLGMACNNRCVFCSNGKKAVRNRGWMRVEEVEKEIDERFDTGLESLGFIGGEPTLYPHLERIIRYARDRGFQRVSICTNGSRLSDPDLLDRLIAAGLTRVAFSIHSHEAKVEDGITRRQGSFDEKVAAIVNLVSTMNAGKLPDGFSLNSVLHAKNLPRLDEFVAFFHELGVSDIRFNFIKPEHQAEGNRDWVPSFAETTPMVRRLVIQNETKFGIHLTFADFPLCRLPWEVLSNPVLFGRYVGEMQDMVTEVTLYRPAEAGGTERFNWKEQRTTYLKCHMEACRSCVLVNKCEGVWKGYLDIYGTDEFLDGPSLAEACRT